MKTVRSVQVFWARVFALAVLVQFPLWCHADPLGTWNLVLSNTPAPLTGMAYGNGTFVGVGNGLDYVSHDGSNWTVYANPTFLNQVGVAFGNGYFLTYGTNVQTQPSYISTSSDGIHWTTIYTNYASIYNAAYGNNTWVFTATTTNAYEILTATVTSSNWNWNQVLLSEAIGPLSFVNNTFVLQIGYYFGDSVFSSSDGLSWQYMSAPFVGGDIVYGNGEYLIADGYAESTSPDLINWTQSLPYLSFVNGFATGHSVGCFNNLFVAVSEVTEDSSYPFPWTASTPFTNQSPVLSSVDGTNWTINGYLTTDNIGYGGYDSVAIPIQFLVYGQGILLTSTGNNIYQSGIFVTNLTPPANTLDISTYSGVTINGTVGAVYRIQYSTDMNTWQTITNLMLPYSPYLWFDTTSTVNGKRFYRSVQVQ